MKTIKNFNVKNKKILMRVDFNIGFDKKGKIKDDFKIRMSLPSIKYLIKKKSKIILISHLGQPGKYSLLSKEKNFKKNRKDFSLKPIALILEKKLKQKVRFIKWGLWKKIKREIDKMENGDIVLLENIRFIPSEIKGDKNFAKKLASLADIFINNAFAVSHRKHSSTYEIAKYLPNGIGFLFEKELKNISLILENPKRPLIAIIGGNKIETKIKIITKLLKISDNLILNSFFGKIIIEILDNSENFFGIDKGVKMDLRKICKNNKKLLLPDDFICLIGNQIKIESLEENMKTQNKICDIGPNTIKKYSKIIKKGETIFWNGPMGIFEDKRFSQGTKKIAQAIIDSNAFSLIGGGDTNAAIKKFRMKTKFDYLSTGGGAMLEFIVNNKLPCFEVLK